MPEITFKDGKVVMQGDKVGTGPECCCGGGGGECSCTSEWGQYCGIDYIAVDFEFSFSNCGGESVTGTLILNEAGNWMAGGYFADANECYFDVGLFLACNDGSFSMTLNIQRVLTPGFGDCCRDGTVLCEDGPFGEVGMYSPTLALPSVTSGGACCPGVLASWEADTTADCPGATVRITGMTKVML